MRRAAARGALAALALACAGPPPAPPGPARVAVEVFRGLAEADVARGVPAPVVVILDVTRSMARPTDAGSPHHVAARRAATRFLNGLAAERPVWLYAVGSGAIAQCQPVYRGTRSSGPDDRDPVLREIASLRVRGEGSLSAALDGVRAELERAGTLDGSRVVVFSDLGDECSGNRPLCDAASRLVDAGVSLDVVAIGAEPAPACLEQPDARAGTTGPAPPPPPPLGVRVITAGADPAVMGCSEAGGLPVAVPEGPGAVMVDLDPPLRVEKRFSGGTRYRLQVLDFPLLRPPARKWRWLATEPEAAGEGAP